MRGSLDRLLQPSTVAVVGLSDNNPRLIEGLRPTFDAGCEVVIVNPRYERVMGRATARSLTDVGRPIDCVMSAVNAERSTELAEEAAALDIGGMVLVANGFAEVGGEGVRLQERLRAAATAGGFAAIGPNGLGFEHVGRGLRLTVAVRETHRRGGISVVSQSGAALTGITMVGNAAGAGFNLLISAGNEAVSDLADFVGYLADDDATTAIGLVIEKIRRPEPFFDAVRRAIAAGKPVVAVKLARSERTRRMAASHTGSLTGDAWTYDVALRQLGVAIARDPEEAADRLALVDKIPRDRWTPVRGLAVVTRTGGFASLTYDVAAEEGIPVPPLDDVLPWIRERIPSVAVPNPLDTAGSSRDEFGEILERYVASADVDALLIPQPMSLEEDHARSVFTAAEAVARRVCMPVVLTNLAGMPPPWASEYEGEAVAFGRGVRQSLRGLRTIGAFVERRNRQRSAAERPAPLPRPATPAVRVDGVEMLPFDAGMRLVAGAGIPVAPFALIPEGADPAMADVAFRAPYVAKLANVPHRTELAAVRLGVARDGLPSAVAELREIATSKGVPGDVAVQPMVASEGEALIGVNASELGPVVVFGLGGVFAEALRRVGGRMAPLDAVDAGELIEEFRGLGTMHGFRGRPAWDLDELARVLVSTGRLAAASRAWLASLDLNPVLYGEHGYTVVDALVVLQSSCTEE